MTPAKLLPWIALAACLAPAGCSRAPAPLSLQAGTALEARESLPEFSLYDQAGRRAGRDDFAGRWSLVFSGFTSCPDICPITVALLAQLDERLRRRGDGVQIVFLTVDPERDSPDVLQRYLGHFGPRLRGMTGAPGEVERLAGALGFAHVRNPGVGGAYTVDHSAALVLVDPDAQVAAYFRPPHDVARLEADLAPLAAGAG